MNLFTINQDVSKLHPKFKQIADSNSHIPAKEMMNKFFELMGDQDGNFVQQFQTTGFDARTFELGLFAYLYTSGHKFIETNGYPDFIVSNTKQLEVCIEATTSNPPHENRYKNSIEHIEELSNDELMSKVIDEVPIKMGSPLFSKLKKKYWEKDQCKNKPIVLAIQPFHEAGSLFYSDATLLSYLYGLRHYPTWSEDGKLIINKDNIDSHAYNEKVIPSNFYGQPHSENISAVIFSNILTIPKFVRMAYQSGQRNGIIVDINRSGTCYNPDPNAAEPLTFEYSLNNPPYKETWGEGLHVIHNPHAKIPLPKNYFPGLTESYIENNEVVTDVRGFHPYTSMSYVQVNRKE